MKSDPQLPNQNPQLSTLLDAFFRAPVVPQKVSEGIWTLQTYSVEHITF